MKRKTFTRGLQIETIFICCIPKSYPSSVFLLLLLGGWGCVAWGWWCGWFPACVVLQVLGFGARVGGCGCARGCVCVCVDVCVSAVGIRVGARMWV